MNLSMMLTQRAESLFVEMKNPSDKYNSCVNSKYNSVDVMSNYIKKKKIDLKCCLLMKTPYKLWVNLHPTLLFLNITNTLIMYPKLEEELINVG